MELAKATLQELSAADPPAPVGEPVPVQFNPASLRLQLSNQVEGGSTRGQQNRQYLGTSSTQLSFDLIFDTADEGSTDAPRSVREETAAVERFVLPRGEGNAKQAPPKVRFHWGSLILDGVIDSLSIDFDHFAANGEPLRAKIGVSIKEQDARYRSLEAGPGANRQGSQPAPGAAGAATPGNAGAGSERSAAALAGESLADFAARQGLDPGAWRGLAAGLSDTLSLAAGLEIGFDANLSLSAGLGVSLGVAAGASLSLEAGLGLSAGLGAAPGVGSGGALVGGLQLAAAGGLDSALQTAAIAGAEQARSAAIAAWGDARPPGASPAGALPASQRAGTRAAPLEPGSGGLRPGLPEQARPPLSRSGLPGASTRAAPLAPPPRADARALSYGRGVPLRPRLGGGDQDAAPPQTEDPTLPGWRALPAGRRVAASGPTHRHDCRCGCRGSRK